MRHLAEAFMMVGIVASLAYCAVRTNEGRYHYTLQKAAMCKEAGGVWDFGWDNCNMSSVNEQ